MEAAGVDQFTLVGTSEGGATAITYTARHPDRVSHLILYGAFGQPIRSERDLAKHDALTTLMRQGWGLKGKVPLGEDEIDASGRITSELRGQYGSNEGRCRHRVSKILVLDGLRSVREDAMRQERPRNWMKSSPADKESPKLIKLIGQYVRSWSWPPISVSSMRGVVD